MEGNNMTSDVYSLLTQKPGLLLHPSSALGMSWNSCLLLCVEDSMFKHQDQAPCSTLPWPCHCSDPQHVLRAVSLLGAFIRFCSGILLHFYQDVKNTRRIWALVCWRLHARYSWELPDLSENLHTMWDCLFSSIYSCSRIPSISLSTSMTQVVRWK